MAITRVNEVASTLEAGSATTIASPAINTSSGNLLVVGIRDAGNTGIRVTGIADTAGNFFRCGSQIAHLTVGGLELWFSMTSAAHATNVVTATFLGSIAFRSIIVAQYSGLSTLSALNAWPSELYTTTTGASPASGAVTSTIADALMVGLFQINTTGTTWTAGSGYTKVTEDGSTVMMLQEKIVAATQSAQTIGATNSDSTTLKIAMGAVFSAASSGGGAGPVVGGRLVH
jgi:hypothetical protein